MRFGERAVTKGAGSISSRASTRSLGVVTALIATTAVPALAQAQAARASTGARTSSCATMASMPTMLVATPEGRSVVRLQRELEAAAQVAARRGEETQDVRNLLSARRVVDSLMHIIVHQLQDSSGRSVFVYSTDSTLRLTATQRAHRTLIEERIREMQPRVAELTRLQFSAAPLAVTQVSSGWIGLRISGSFVREATPRGLVTRYCDEYPVIEAVDPGSPAEKGGLQAGDTLIAFNGRDVLATPIVHADVFVPLQELRVKVRRTGRVRETPIVVAQPRGNTVQYTVTPGAACAPGQACAFTMLRDTIRGTLDRAPGVVMSGVYQPAQAVTVRGAPPVPVVGMLTREAGTSMIAGAQVTVVNRELALNLGLHEGLLVTRVLGGTPMAEAGIKAGDVVRVVNGVAARDIAVLHQAFAAGVREVRMSVATKGQENPRIVVVRW